LLNGADLLPKFRHEALEASAREARNCTHASLQEAALIGREGIRRDQ